MLQPEAFKQRIDEHVQRQKKQELGQKQRDEEIRNLLIRVRGRRIARWRLRMVEDLEYCEHYDSGDGESLRIVKV